MAFGGKAKQAASATNGHPPEVEEAVGYEMGAGSGSGDDGAGTYEMVHMEPRPEPT